MNISSATASSITNMIQQSTQTKNNRLTYSDLTTYSIANSMSASDYEKYAELNSSSEVSSYTNQLSTLLSSASADTSEDDASVLSSIISSSTNATIYTSSGAASNILSGLNVDTEA